MKRPFSLPVRSWLVVVIIAISVISVSVEFALTYPLVNHWQQQAEHHRLDSVRSIIGNQPAQWASPAWRRHASAKLAPLGVQAAIFPPNHARPLFATAGARQYFTTSPVETGVQSSTLAFAPPSTALPILQRLVIFSPARHHAVGIAFLWYTTQAPGQPSIIWWFAVAYITIALLVGAVIWLLNKYVLRPLLAMNRAAESIAGGDLDVHLPSSPVREIAEVGAALQGMSGSLRESLARQSALEEERRLFVSAVAHDLRTPLFMLRGYLRGLQTGVANSPEKVSHYVDVSLAKADALEHLIADLFAFTRLEYLEQEPEREPLELGALLHAVADGVQPLAAERRVTVLVEGPERPTDLLGDRHLLSRAVENLVDNALRHTPEGGAVWLRWGREGEKLFFSVQDTGPGIAAHDLPHIFTPLYRAETSRNRQTGGAGLGLAIAQRIVRAHGGELTASNLVEGGAVFTAVLPVASQARQIPEEVVSGHVGE